MHRHRVMDGNILMDALSVDLGLADGIRCSESRTLNHLGAYDNWELVTKHGGITPESD